MQNIGLIFLVFAFVLAVIAACFMQSAGRFHLGWAAVAFWIAAELIGGLPRAFGPMRSELNLPQIAVIPSLVAPEQR